jgi:hypothetical protein
VIVFKFSKIIACLAWKATCFCSRREKQMELFMQISSFWTSEFASRPVSGLAHALATGKVAR